MTTSNFFNWSSVRSAGLTMKTKTLTCLCIAFACFMFIGSAKAQVTIGSGLAPEGGSILDMKEFTAGAANETSKKGLLYPRVELSDTYTSELHPMFDVNSTEYKNDKVDLKKKHIGLIVFNVTNSKNFSPGLYFWNGIDWRRMDDSPAEEASITDLLCSNATMSPSSYTGGTPFVGIVKVPYIEGTGGTYDGTAPIGGTPATNNLYIERIGGKLNYGSGEVMYRVTGTPTQSSPSTATFPLSFLGKTCDITVGSGVSSVNLKNLTNDIIVNTPYTASSEGSANELTFVGGDIIIKEAGSFAFSLRLYGRLGQEGGARWPFYIYLQKNNKTTIIDAAEIDLVTVNSGGYPDFSYSITLGGVYEVGDKVIISMCKPNTGPTWTLRQGSTPNSNVRTSLIYWKL